MFPSDLRFQSWEQFQDCLVPEILEAMYHATRLRYRRNSDQAAGLAALAVDTMSVNGVKKHHIRHDRYNPWAAMLKRHEATRCWRYRTARILLEQLHNLPAWVKDEVDWESVGLLTPNK